MTRQANDVEDILAAFAVEPNHDKATLDRYLSAYPDLRSALLDLVLDLEFDGIDDSPLDLESSLVADSWERYSQSAKQSLTSKSFTKDAAKALGVKTTVIMQLRDRAVSVSSIPGQFMVRLAEALGASVDELTSYLSGPRTLAVGASYKADGKPSAAPQMALSDLLAQCGHSPLEIAQLVGEA